MTENSRSYQLCFAQIQTEGLFGEDVIFESSLIDSLSPEKSITRYQREWHVTRLVHQDSGLLYGEFGYVSVGKNVPTLGWNDTEGTFVKGNATSGQISPFVIDIATGRCCFQLRPGKIRPTTFTGNMQELLNLGSLSRWTVAPLVIERSFDEWRTALTTVTSFKFRLERPNPNYVGRPKIQEMVEDLRLEVANLSGRVQKGESIDTDDPLFTQAMDHVARNYGTGLVVGETQDGEQQEWHARGGGSVPVIQRVEASGGSEASLEILVSAISQDAQGAVVSEVSDIDDE